MSTKSTKRSGYEVCLKKIKDQKKPHAHNFSPAILGPEVAAPILWAPGFVLFFCCKSPHAHTIPRFMGGLGGFWKGGWKCQFFFMGVWIFVPKRGLNGSRLTLHAACSSFLQLDAG